MEGARSFSHGLMASSTSVHGNGHAAPNQELLKMRNSCDACASSKLKCSGDKPVCSRCSKRGLICQYFAAKRGGRKPSNRANATSSSQASSSSSSGSLGRRDSSATSSSWVGSSSNADSRSRASVSSGTSRTSPSTSHHGSSDMLQDYFGGDQSVLSFLADTTNPNDDFYNSFDIFGGASDICFGDDYLPDAFTDSGSDTQDLFMLPSNHSAPMIPKSVGKDKQSSHKVHSTHSPCPCLVEALGIMKELCPSYSELCMTFCAQNTDLVTAIQSIKSIFTRTDATIEAVSAMLQCACSQNGYLLTIIALIIFKVMGWYGAIARKTLTFQDHKGRRHQLPPLAEEVSGNGLTTVGKYSLNGADPARMAAQIVLNELHRVRRLAEQLSLKLEAKAGEKCAPRSEQVDSLDMESELLPLSEALYDQLDAGLRRRVKTLSVEMIDRLRRL